jgi:predicted esterase
MTLTRREFVQAAASAAAAGLLACSRNGQPSVPAEELAYATLKSRPRNPTEKVRRGLQPLRLRTGRDGFLYVPPLYSPEKATPLVVLLHGAGRHSSDWSSPRFAGLFDDPPIVVIAPDSRGSTWDVLRGGFGPDVGFIDESLDLVFGMCNVDPGHVALGGFSDGASYALSLGLANGDLFNALIAFSPGFNEPPTRRGKPRIFVAHGRQDQILAIDGASRPIVRALRNDGYEVEYEEFEGRHTVTADEVTRAMRWFVGG